MKAFIAPVSETGDLVTFCRMANICRKMARDYIFSSLFKASGVSKECRNRLVLEGESSKKEESCLRGMHFAGSNELWRIRDFD